MVAAKKKKKKKIWLNWLLVIILVAAVATVSIISWNKTKQETRWKLQEFQETESVYTGDLQLTVLAPATLHPYELLEVRPEASGRIEELYVDVGDFINEGDPIATLDQESLLIQLDTAKAELSRVRANYESIRRGYSPRELQNYESAVDTAQIALNQALENLERTKELHEAGFASDQELDNAEYAVEQAQLQLDQATEALAVLLEGSTSEEIQSARAAVLIAEAQVQSATNALGDATIYSPMTGVIITRYVTEGSVVVSTLASFSAGDAICSIGDLTRMKAFASVDESDIGDVEVGQTCNIDVDAYRGEPFEGHVIKIHPMASETGGTNSFTTDIEVPNTDGRLKSGMNAEVEIITKVLEDLLLVPDRAIVERSEKSYVFVVDENDKIEVREIEVGETNFEFTEVTKGLEEGEMVIVRGVPRDLLDEKLGKEKSEDNGGARVEVE